MPVDPPAHAGRPRPRDKRVGAARLRGALALSGCGLGVLLLGTPACESERHPRQDAPAVADAATPSMKAEGVFFSGQIGVEVLLNRTGFAAKDQAEAADNTGSGSGGGGGGGGGGGRHRRSGGGGGGEAVTSQDASGTLRGSNLPAVRLHVRLTNHGAQPVDLSVTDFDSDLGDFAVQPDRNSLRPNEAAETDPMTSRLGISSDEIPVKVSIMMGGREETQTLTLRIIKEPPPLAPVPGAVQPVPQVPPH